MRKGLEDGLRVEGGPGSVALPELVEPKRKDGVESIRAMVDGLMAVGVDPFEAYMACLKSAEPEGMLDLIVERFGLTLDCSYLLYHLSSRFEDKAYFGRRCLDHGISPVGVASCAEKPRECKELVEQFGVDTWLYAHYVDGETDIGYADFLVVDLAKAPIRDGAVCLSGNLMCLRGIHVVNGSRFEGGVVIPNVVEILHGLILNESTCVSMPDLACVGGDMHAIRSTKACFPELVKVRGRLEVDGSLEFSAPKLLEVRGDLFAEETSLLRLPKLETLIGKAYLFAAEGMDLGKVDDERRRG